MSLQVTRETQRRGRSFEFKEVLVQTTQDSAHYIVTHATQRVLNLVKIGDTITFYTKSDHQSDLSAGMNEILQLETRDFNRQTQPVLEYSRTGTRQLSLIFLIIGCVLGYNLLISNRSFKGIID